jgi:hypothetical protein
MHVDLSTTACRADPDAASVWLEEQRVSISSAMAEDGRAHAVSGAVEDEGCSRAAALAIGDEHVVG